MINRTEALLGEDFVSSIETKTVALAGLGAVGGLCFETLVRAGVGNFIIADFDTFEKSNLNRQILALNSTIGKKKTEVALSRALDINPSVKIKAINAFISSENVSIFSSADLIIDCIDSVKSKADIIAFAQQKGIKVISSMGAALRKDAELIRTGYIKDTAGCPLARALRKELRKRGCSLDVACVYSSERVDFDYDKNRIEKDDEKKKSTALGSLASITNIFASRISHAALCMLYQRDSLSSL
ncbi:MAG TPA: ThiF family adenylyltransferase [Candidatus Ornithospirochaeta avicola]|uniref:ThiF family adenylyltransferase n=1 Tax=Candidatus Ornithospirochaeta avicola TaxID=2840896 RepID=A0A9D1PT68_9SPIO|nr:ThiF family adenylyltransferase [Candidatus Ornithospirochaeta avicola]